MGRFLTRPAPQRMQIRHETRKCTKPEKETRGFGMKFHVGVDAGSGLVHTIPVNPANRHDITQAASLIREDDEVV